MSNKRVHCNAAAQVVPKLKTARRDGTTHILTSPAGFMRWLAALVLGKPNWPIMSSPRRAALDFTDQASRASRNPLNCHCASGGKKLR